MKLLDSKMFKWTSRSRFKHSLALIQALNIQSMDLCACTKQNALTNHFNERNVTRQGSPLIHAFVQKFSHWRGESCNLTLLFGYTRGGGGGRGEGISSLSGLLRWGPRWESWEKQVGESLFNEEQFVDHNSAPQYLHHRFHVLIVRQKRLIWSEAKNILMEHFDSRAN